jgi:hypothetical protein
MIHCHQMIEIASSIFFHCLLSVSFDDVKIVTYEKISSHRSEELTTSSKCFLSSGDAVLDEIIDGNWSHFHLSGFRCITLRFRSVAVSAF